MLEDQAQRSVNAMEDKKQRYKALLEELADKNHQFVDVLEKLTKQHGKLVD